MSDLLASTPVPVPVPAVGTRCVYCGAFDADPDKIHCGLADGPAHIGCADKAMTMLADRGVPVREWAKTMRALNPGART